MKKKTCGKCGKCKSLTSYSKNSKASDGRQSYCIECKASYYQWERKQPTFDGRLLNKDSKPKSKLLAKIKQAKAKQTVVHAKVAKGA